MIVSPATMTAPPTRAFGANRNSTTGHEHTLAPRGYRSQAKN